MGWVVLTALWVMTACGGPPSPTSLPSPRAEPVAERPSRNELSELKPASVKVLSKLEGPLEATIYASSSQPKILAALRDIERLMSAYQKASNGKLTVQVRTMTSPTDRKEADDLGILPFADERADWPSAYLGMVLVYRGHRKVVPQLFPKLGRGGTEYWITNKLRELLASAHGTQQRVGVIAKKGELELSDRNLVPRTDKSAPGPSFQSIMTQAFPFYRFDEVDLKGGAAAVDTELVGLIVTQPSQDYTDAELRRIDEFVMRGNKALAVFASAVSLVPRDVNMSAVLDLHNLDRLLSGYGIRMNEDVVLDFGDSFRVEVKTEKGNALVVHPAIAHVTSQPEPPDGSRLDVHCIPFLLMDDLVLPFPSSLTLLPDRQPQATLRSLARTTSKSTVERTRKTNMALRAEWKVSGPLEPRTIAAMVEGKLRSAFDGATTTPSDKPSRVLVISSSLFLTNPFAYAGNDASGDNEILLTLAQPYAKHLVQVILAFKNTIDWMMSEGDFVDLGTLPLGGTN